MYAVLREDWTTGGGHTVCASTSSRQSDVGAAQLVYTSTSNVVEVRLVTSRQSTQFLVKVQCKAHFTVLHRRDSKLSSICGSVPLDI